MFGMLSLGAILDPQSPGLTPVPRQPESPGPNSASKARSLAT